MEPSDPSTSMNVSLPASLRAYVDDLVGQLGYTSASEYVRELIRKDRDRRSSEEKLEELLVEGLRSGPAADWTDDDWTAIRRRVAARIAKRRRSG
jgi:antitoxin ParD1/3/4